MKRQSLHDQSGAVAIVAAATMFVLLLMSAFVIDLGFLRADRVESQSLSDMAVTAAVVDYTPGVDGQAREACESAVQFAEANLEVSDPLTALTSCLDAFPDTFDAACDPTDPQRAIFEAGPYTINIMIPVPDDDPMMESHPDRDADFDGEPCQRVGVEVFRDRQFFFGGIAGNLGSASERGAVARTFVGDDSEDYASLVVLRRQGCLSLTVGGGPKIRVLDLETTVDGEPATFPGFISVDTQYANPAGVACNNRKVFRAQGSSLIQASGEIFSYGLASSDPGNQNTWDESQNFDPKPIRPGRLLTRSLIDHVVNCKPGGYGSGAWEPSSSQPIDACPHDDRPAYMDRLHAQLATGSSVPTVGGAWTTYDDCNGLELEHDVAAGDTPNVFFDCDELRFPQVELRGVENIVVQGGIDMNNNAHYFDVVGHASKGANLVLREGALERNGGDYRLRNVFTYLAASGDDGFLDARGNNADLMLKAPLNEAGCSSTDPAPAPPTAPLPEAACFSPLAMWINGTEANTVSGDARGGVIGTVFVPNAPWTMQASNPDSTAPCSGSVSWNDLNTAGTSLNLEAAQFIAEAFNLSGGSTLRMCPSPDTTFETPLFGSGMIR